MIPGISTDSGVGLEPIPANTALGNFSGSSAIPTAQDKNQWLVWLDVPSNFAFGALSSTVIGLAGDLVDLETLVNTKIDSSDSRLTNAREWTASTVSQAEAEAGIATARRAWTAERVRQAAEALNVERGVYDRAGFVYDHPEGNRALECSDSEWVFGSTLQRDNLRTALNAVETFLTFVTGSDNRFEVTPPSDAYDFARLWYSSHSGPLNDNFGSVQIIANPEEGVLFSAQQNGLGAQQYVLQVSPTGFYVGGQAAFRAAISAVETFDTNITGGQSAFQVVPPVNAAGFANFFFASHSGPAGDNFGTTFINAEAETGILMASASGHITMQAGARALAATPTGYEVTHPAEFREAIKTPSRDEALYYAIALGGI